MKDPFPTESPEAPELERRRLMDANESFAQAMRKRHPERVAFVQKTPATERARRWQRPVEVRTTGWAFE